MEKDNLALKFRVVLIGCGRISNSHIKALSSLTHYFDLVALCDSSSTALQACVDNFRDFANLFSFLIKIKNFKK